jgi:DNA-binding transcriptional MerR regulator
VHSADVIRVGQALGLSLREIGELRKARRSGDLPRKKRIALMQDQLARLEAKAAELEKLKSYVRAKIDWQQGGEKGDEPTLSHFTGRTKNEMPQKNRRRLTSPATASSMSRRPRDQ